MAEIAIGPSKAEDSPHVSGDSGVMALAVRNDAGAPLAADGDYIPITTDSTGALRVTGGGGGTQYVEDTPHVSGDTGTLALTVRNDAGTPLAADGDYIPMTTDSTGALRVTGGSGGTQYAEDTAHVSGDTLTLAGVVQQTADAALSSDGDRSLLQVDATGFAKVNVKTSALPTGAATAANQTTEITSLQELDNIVHSNSEGQNEFALTGGVVDDVATVQPAEGQVGSFRITPFRGQHVNLRTTGGTEIGTAASPIRNDPTGTTTQPVSAATLPLPTGAATAANQATEIASLSVLDDWDETDRAKVNTIVGQAGVQGGSGTVSANTQRVVLATDVTPPLPTGAATLAEQQLQTTALQIIDDWDETDRAKVNPIVGQAGVAAGNGTVDALTQRVVLATDGVVPLPTGAATLAEQQTQTTALQIMDDWDESDRAKVNPIVGQAGVQGGSGTVSALTQRVVLATDVALPRDFITDQTFVVKTVDWAAAATGTTIWDPAGGQRFNICDIVASVSGASTITIFDETDTTALRVFKASLAANGGAVINYRKPYRSAAADNILKITIAGAGAIGFITVSGYESA